MGTVQSECFMQNHSEFGYTRYDCCFPTLPLSTEEEDGEIGVSAVLRGVWAIFRMSL